MSAAQSPQDIAEAVREAMFAKDRASQALGMRVDAIAPGRACVSMTVREDMLNGFDICHGGLITALADTAFAFACNAGNEQTVASGIQVDILIPSRLGDVLRAEAHEVSQGGRTGVYDVNVHNQRQELVAVFRGKSYRLKGRAVVPGLAIAHAEPE